jgi:hypothetical protein
MDRLTESMDGDFLPPSALNIDGLLDTHLTEEVIKEMDEFSKLFKWIAIQFRRRLHSNCC